MKFTTVRENDFGRFAHDFQDVMTFDTLFDKETKLFKLLSHVKIDDEYVLGRVTFEKYGASYSRFCCCKESASQEYPHVFDRTGDGIIEENRVITPFDPELHYIESAVDWDTADSIPEIWEHLKIDFTPMGVWQAYMLYIAKYLFYSCGDEAVKERRYYIFSLNDFMYHNLTDYGILRYVHDGYILPTVTIAPRDCALIMCCYWNHEKGLIQERIAVREVNKRLQFKQLESEVLVKCKEWREHHLG